jgi:signal peptidase II
MPIRTLGNVDEPADDARGDDHSPGALPVGVTYALAAAIVVIDQAAKLAAVHWLRGAESIALTSWLSFTWATNTGGAFGVFASSTLILAAVALVVVVALVLIAGTLGGGRLTGVAVASVMGGALGNFIDRVRVGYVIDYIDLHFWPVFNIADIAITVGAALMVIAVLTGHPHPAESGEDSD